MWLHIHMIDVLPITSKKPVNNPGILEIFSSDPPLPVPGKGATGVGASGLPWWGRGLRDLPLHPSMSDQVPLERVLHLCWDIRWSVADFQRSFKHLGRSFPIFFDFLFLAVLQNLRGSAGVALWDIAGTGGEGFAPPAGPAQLPKDKKWDHQQGEPAEADHHC